VLRYGPGYRSRHRTAIEAEPWCHNPRCPYPDAGTPSNPLQADHPLAIANGGSPLQALVPLCRSCHGAKSRSDRMMTKEMSTPVGGTGRGACLSRTQRPRPRGQTVCTHPTSVD